MASPKRQVYYVFLNYDPEYDRLRADQTEKGIEELDMYLSTKHDQILANTLETGSYNKMVSLAIVDAFAVEITEEQAKLIRSVNGVRAVEKNMELFAEDL